MESLFSQTFLKVAIATTLALPTILLGGGLFATQAQEVPKQLTPQQLQQLSHDLVPSSSRKFFTQGTEAFEREIQVLTQGILFSPNRLLKVNQSMRIKGDLSPIKNPNPLLNEIGQS
jgi:hypothetical protein